MMKASIVVRDYIQSSPTFKGVPMIATLSPWHNMVRCGQKKIFDIAELTAATRGFEIPAAKEKVAAFKGTKFRVLDVTALSLWRADAHTADCSHWCSPGVIDVWIDIMYQLLGSSQ